MGSFNKDRPSESLLPTKQAIDRLKEDIKNGGDIVCGPDLKVTIISEDKITELK